MSCYSVPQQCCRCRRSPQPTRPSTAQATSVDVNKRRGDVSSAAQFSFLQLCKMKKPSCFEKCTIVQQCVRSLARSSHQKQPQITLLRQTAAPDPERQDRPGSWPLRKTGVCLAELPSLRLPDPPLHYPRFGLPTWNSRSVRRNLPALVPSTIGRLDRRNLRAPRCARYPCV